jgi:hypothetical protein
MTATTKEKQTLIDHLVVTQKLIAQAKARAETAELAADFDQMAYKLAVAIAMVEAE